MILLLTDMINYTKRHKKT